MFWFWLVLLILMCIWIYIIAYTMMRSEQPGVALPATVLYRWGRL